ncbi:MAG: hypothetical protein VX745_01355, partial [Pseudomonadota bacterium]|nr:hypothetical protein [Pseudomonadota bacterium]
MTPTTTTITPQVIVPGAIKHRFSLSMRTLWLVTLLFVFTTTTANVSIAPDPVIREAILPEPLHSGTARNIVDAMAQRHY